MPNNIIKIFNNDYNQSCHPIVMQAIANTNNSRNNGYGLDDISQSVATFLLEKCQAPKAKIHFLVGGTITNLLAISAFLRPHQAVISAQSGHIGVHETGAIEATGHKILTVASTDGKLYPEQVKAVFEAHDNEHMVQPKLVYISQSTELGTVYNKEELNALAKTCKKLGLYLFVDGARLGAAMTCKENMPTLVDLAQMTDAFYIGGTKNGALFGEALVIVNKSIQKDFRHLCKQRGAMLAKGWLISAQFEALFTDNLYYDLAKNANEVAQYIDEQLKEMQIPLFIPTNTNQIFPILPVAIAKELAKKYAFQTWTKSKDVHAIRFVTSWSSSIEDAKALIATLKDIL